MGTEKVDSASDKGGKLMDIIGDTTRKSNKKHICSYCGQEIPIGETYLNSVLVNDGKLYHWKSHLTCEEITKKLKMFDDFQYDEGLTADDFRECVDWFLKEKNIWFKTWPERIAKAKEILCK